MNLLRIEESVIEIDGVGGHITINGEEKVISRMFIFANSAHKFVGEDYPFEVHIQASNKEGSITFVFFMSPGKLIDNNGFMQSMYFGTGKINKMAVGSSFQFKGYEIQGNVISAGQTQFLLYSGEDLAGSCGKTLYIFSLESVWISEKEAEELKSVPKIDTALKEISKENMVYQNFNPPPPPPQETPIKAPGSRTNSTDTPLKNATIDQPQLINATPLKEKQMKKLGVPANNPESPYYTTPDNLQFDLESYKYYYAQYPKPKLDAPPKHPDCYPDRRFPYPGTFELTGQPNYPNDPNYPEYIFPPQPPLMRGGNWPPNNRLISWNKNALYPFQYKDSMIPKQPSKEAKEKARMLAQDDDYDPYGYDPYDYPDDTPDSLPTYYDDDYPPDDTYPIEDDPNYPYGYPIWPDYDKPEFPLNYPEYPPQEPPDLIYFSDPDPSPTYPPEYLPEEPEREPTEPDQINHPPKQPEYPMDPMLKWPQNPFYTWPPHPDYDYPNDPRFRYPEDPKDPKYAWPLDPAHDPRWRYPQDPSWLPKPRVPPNPFESPPLSKKPPFKIPKELKPDKEGKTPQRMPSKPFEGDSKPDKVGKTPTTPSGSQEAPQSPDWEFHPPPSPNDNPEHPGYPKDYKGPFGVPEDPNALPYPPAGLYPPLQSPDLKHPGPYNALSPSKKPLKYAIPEDKRPLDPLNKTPYLFPVPNSRPPFPAPKHLHPAVYRGVPNQPLGLIPKFCIPWYEAIPRDCVLYRDKLPEINAGVWEVFCWHPVPFKEKKTGKKLLKGIHILVPKKKPLGKTKQNKIPVLIIPKKLPPKGKRPQLVPYDMPVLETPLDVGRVGKFKRDRLKVNAIKNRKRKNRMIKYKLLKPKSPCKEDDEKCWKKFSERQQIYRKNKLNKLKIYCRLQHICISNGIKHYNITDPNFDQEKPFKDACYKFIRWRRRCVRIFVGVLVNRHFQNKHSWKIKDYSYDKNGNIFYCAKWIKTPLFRRLKSCIPVTLGEKMTKKDIDFICKHKLSVILNRGESRELGDSIERNCKYDKKQIELKQKALPKSGNSLPQDEHKMMDFLSAQEESLQKEKEKKNSK